MAKYHIETTNGTYEVETDEAPTLGEQPASFGGVAKTMASQAGTALSTAASDIAGAPAAIAGAIRHPVDTFKAGISSPKLPQVPESELPQDAFHRFQRTMGGGPNYHPMGENTPTSEVVGHGLALGAMNAAPSVIGKLPKAVDTAMERLPQGGGIHPDVRAGAVKMAAGAAGAELLPGPLKWPARILGLYPGARQLWRGLNNPDAYAQEAVGEIPTIKNPAANAPPAVFGNAADFAKLPKSVQDAVLRGQSTIPRGSSTPGPGPVGPIEWRTPEEIAAAKAPGITSPKPTQTITVPATGAAEVVERVEHPPFAPDRPFPKSQKIREQTPSVKTEEAANLDAQVDRLRKAFPWETDQQLRARATHANVMSKISSQPGGMAKAQKLRESLGGK